MTDARADRLPEIRAASGDDTSGRGLRLVDALATEWGVTERAVGKTVWAECALPE